MSSDDAKGPGPAEAKQARPVAKYIRRLAAIILATYLGVCIFVSVFQTSLIYFPSREYRATPADIGLDFEDLTLHTSDGTAIAAWMVNHPAAKATILFCHGNAGNIADRLHSLQVLHNFGYSVLIFDYRGFGRSEGQPGEEGTYRDAEAAWSYLANDRSIPPDRIVIFGRSLGGAVAIELATRVSPAALVVESTFTQLADIGAVHYPLIPVRLLLIHRYRSIEKVARLDCPKLFLHGTHDELIPISNGRRLFEAAKAPKLFIETRGGHTTAGFTSTSENANKLAAFLDQALGGDTGNP